MTYLLNSRYHSVSEFQDLRIEKNFNIFHANVNGLETKFDVLHTFLSGSRSAMGVLGITETSENSDDSFLANVSLAGFKIYNTASNSARGGVALYACADFDTFERVDLKVQDDGFQGVWLEIKNKGSKNIICGCVYRHPRYDNSSFLVYMETILKKITDENKELYVCGDFNIDLLKIESGGSPLTFYNLLACHGLLPFIIHPSRVVEGQIPSLIDNIFSNNIQNNVLSGNIYFTLSEHFSQFASVMREKVDVRKVTMFGRDYSKYSVDKFRDDVSIQAFSHESTDVNILFGGWMGVPKGMRPPKSFPQRTLNFV